MPATNQLPTGQNWLLERMDALKYPYNKKGMCLGIAHMGRQAFLANDLATFKRRFLLTNEIDPTEFSSRMETLKNKRLSLIEKIKGDLLALTLAEKAHLEKQVRIQKKINELEIIIADLIKAHRLNREEADKEFERRKAFLLFNAQLQEAINKETQQLSEDERILLDLPIFFEDIELYHQPYHHCSIFDDNSKVLEATDVAPLLQPVSLTEQGIEAKKLTEFSGAYNLSDLIKLLQGFSAAVKTSEHPFIGRVAFTLSDSQHGISIGYDAGFDMWYFIDANQISDIDIPYTAKQIANKIPLSFFQNDTTVFRTEIFANDNDAPRLNKCINVWQQQEAWLAMHDEKQKVHYSDSNNVTWLHTAAKYGHMDRVKKLLTQGADVNRASKDHAHTPLRCALSHIHLDIAQELLNYGADPDKACDEGLTSLMLAARCNFVTIFDELLKHSVDINKADNNGETALFKAVQFNHVDIVKKLLTRGADTNKRTSQGISPLHIAAEKGNTEIINELLKFGADVNASLPNGITPLYFAAQDGHIDNVVALLAAGANPNKAKEDGNTPLIKATEANAPAVVKSLLAYQANPNATGVDGKTALFLAAEYGYGDIVKELLINGANPNIPNSKGVTPLQMAAFYGDIDVMQELLAHGADPNQMDNNGAMALFVAAQYNRLDAVKLLLEKNASSTIPFRTSHSSLSKFFPGKENYLMQVCRTESTTGFFADPIIAITPYEIASAMGYTDIANLIRCASDHSRIKQKESQFSSEMDIHKRFKR